MERLLTILVSASLLLGADVAGRAATTLPPGFAAEQVGSGWVRAVGVAFDPSAQGRGRVYVWERGGKVWLVENGVKAAQPMLDISDEVGWWGDHGLMGFALDPAFQQNGYIYLLYIVDRHHLLYAGTPAYSPTTNEYNAATIGRITRYTARASDGFRTVDPASRKILVGESKSTGFPIVHLSHGAGTLAFGTDGTLLASFGSAASYTTLDDGGGDGGSYTVQALADGIIRPQEDVGSFRSQVVDCLNGKIVRIDPATGDGVASNPFFDPAHPRAPRSRVWALGLRNPFRFTIRPETGSHLAADGNPGVLVLGDVGDFDWEEVDVVDGPGQNFGWPLFQGLTDYWAYWHTSVAENLDAPNPLGGYFQFQKLIVQDTLAVPSWPNPLNPALQVPASIPHFVHKRPAIDWGRGTAPVGPARTGTFNGTVAAQVLIGDPASPVSGAQFLGSCSMAGCFYTGTNFPANYRGLYFFADYTEGWVKMMSLDANNRPTQIADFGTIDHPVCINMDPATGELYYCDLIDHLVYRIYYAPGGNRVPTATAAANVSVGPSPLTVTFSSAGSIDPDGTPLTYLWDFADGTTSTAVNPMHVFTVAGTKRFDVVLTVTDAGGATATATVPVFVNHTLPAVKILSPIDGAKYRLDAETPYTLLGKVTEVAGHPTTAQWDIFLHHQDHEHPEPPILGTTATIVVSPIYSPAETYYYRMQFTVTDDLGAKVQREVRLYPNATNVAPTVAWSSPSQRILPAATARIIDPAAVVADADSPGLELGELQVSVGAAQPADQLSILPEGAGGHVTLNGANVLYDGTVIGVASGGTGSVPLSIGFNEAATPAIAQAVLRRAAAKFASVGTRFVSATLDDGDGGRSVAATTACIVAPDSTPVVTFASASYVISEAGGAVILTVKRTGDTSAPVWVSYSTADGSALAGLDYTPVQDTLNIPAGQASTTIAIPILPDNLNEPDEVFYVMLGRCSAGPVVGTPYSAAVTIKNESRPAFQFDATAFTANENSGAASIVVTRTGVVSPAVSVHYSTGGGTAVAGTDYVATSGVLSFASGETRKRFSIPLINNTTSGPDKTVNLRLTSPSAGALLGANQLATLRIADDENSNGVLQFSSGARAFVNEDAGFVTLVVTRVGGTAGAVSATYKTFDGSAVAGTDYVATTGTVSFAVGAKEAYIKVPILNDAISEPEENFQVRLSAATGGATIGGANPTNVAILDDDGPGGLVQFAGDVTVSEAAGVATLTVVRTGAATNSVSVTYSTADSTAKAGSDYTATSGTLTFAPGETSKMFTVPILNGTIAEPLETFGVGLSAPTGGAVIGARTWAVVTIVDND